MAKFLLHHRHQPAECGVAFASFRGHVSDLRRKSTVGSCASGGHEIWWVVDAATPAEALAMLPDYVAKRTEPTPVQDVRIP
jgi:hypothetical protein